MAQTGSGWTNFDDLKDLAINCYDLVIGLAQNLQAQHSQALFNQPIIELQTLRERINQCTGPFLTIREFENYVRPMTDALIRCNGRISPQLENFWQAQLDISNEAISNNTTYNPQQLASQSLDKILRADEIYQEIVIKINAEPNDKVNLYSLFYALIVSTQTTEHTFREQFNELIRKYQLQNTHDVEEIFSVQGKVPRGNNFRTDTRAIRDSLSHFQYTIVQENSLLKIKFDNQEHGYNFVRDYTKLEFMQFAQDGYLLYKIQAYMIWLFVGNATINAAFIS